MLIAKQLGILLLSIQACVRTDSGALGNMETRAWCDLKSLLYSESGWVKVHVAEFLLEEAQFVDEIRAEFLREEQQFGQVSKYRIGIWRVLARAAETTDERKRWENEIKRAYQDVDGPDRLHAIETLAKLQCAVAFDKKNLYAVLQKEPDAFALYSLWNLAYHPSESTGAIRKTLIALLERQKAVGQFQTLPVTSFVIRNLKPYSDDDWNRIYQVATTFEGMADTRASLLATAWITAPPDAKRAQLSIVRETLESMKGEDGVLLQFIYALSAYTDKRDMQMLWRLYDELRNTDTPGYDPDIHAAAAYAVLMSVRRVETNPDPTDG